MLAYNSVLRYHSIIHSICILRGFTIWVMGNLYLAKYTNQQYET